MAGSMAGLAAGEAGAEVTLVMSGPGASALSNGTLDFAGSEQLHSLTSRIGHPLHVLRETLSRTDEVLAKVAARLSPLLAGPPGTDGDRQYVTVLGTLRRAGRVQRAQADGSLEAGTHYAVAGFELQPGLVDADLVARSLSERGFTASAFRVPYLDRDEDAVLTPFELAARLDHPEQVERLAAALSRALPPGCERVLLPPVLGLARSDIAALLGQRLGVPCAELLPLTPSVPGLRLSRALAAARAAGALRVVEGKLIRLKEGSAELSSGEVLTFDAAVLASGRFLGGGIARRSQTLEPLARLPVSDGRQSLPDASGSGAMAGAEFGAEAALFRAGVEVDGSLRALDAERRSLRWLYAAGAVLAGADGAVDGTGLGLAAFNGYRRKPCCSVRMILPHR